MVEQQAASDLVTAASENTAAAEGEEVAANSSEKSAPADRSKLGPFDPAEVPAIRPYIDFGGIKVAPREGLQLRLEVDEQAQRVVAVSLEIADSLLQVQAFAAPKTRGMWHETRAELCAQLQKQGAKLQEVTGPLGPELLAATPAATEAGGERAARFIGVDGPRWMLRGVVIGRAFSDEAAFAQVLELFRDIVVVRGEMPMPPGELLALKVPDGVSLDQQAAQAAQ